MFHCWKLSKYQFYFTFTLFMCRTSVSKRYLTWIVLMHSAKNIWRTYNYRSPSMAGPSVWPWPEWPLSGDPNSIPDQEQDDLRVPEEAGDDAADGPGAGRRHHRVPPVRDRAQGGHHLHQGDYCKQPIVFLGISDEIKTPNYERPILTSDIVIYLLCWNYHTST